MTSVRKQCLNDDDTGDDNGNDEDDDADDNEGSNGNNGGDDTTHDMAVLDMFSVVTVADCITSFKGFGGSPRPQSAAHDLQQH